MFDYLSQIDTEIFLFLNGRNSAFWDGVMFWISGKIQWFPLYIGLLAWLIYVFRWKAFIIGFFIIILITLADQGAVLLFKDNIQRLRPCHDPDIQHLVHTVNNYCGGKYGFVSNHAANTFALAMFTSILFKIRWYTYCIFAWALLVSYSRIYLGVHYPGDIIGGAIWGIAAAIAVFYLYRHFESYLTRKKAKKQR